MAIPTSIETTAAPSAPIVSEADLRLHVGVPSSGAVGAGLTVLETAAAEMLDGPDSLTGVCWRSRGLRVEYRGPWPQCPPTPFLPLSPGVSDLLWLPGPVSTVTATYTDSAGAAQPIASPDIWVGNNRHYLALPDRPDDYGGAIAVAYTSPGHSPIPEGVKLLVRWWVAAMWTERAAFSSELTAETPAARALLAKHRVRMPVE